MSEIITSGSSPSLDVNKQILYQGKNGRTFAFIAGMERFEIDQTNYHSYEVYKIIDNYRLFVGKYVADEPHRALIKFLSE